MGDTASRILLFALVAGASPIAIVSTLAVLTSTRGRTNGIAFLVGFLLGQSAAFLAAFLVGSAATTDREENEHVAAALELAFGAALLAIAWPERRHAHGTGERSLQDQGAPRPAEGAPARALRRAGHAPRRRRREAPQHHDRRRRHGGHRRPPAVEEVALGALYVVVAGALVWLPVGVYLVAGERADDWMTRAEDWLTTNERRLTFFSTVLFGFLLTSDALVRLL